VPGLRVGHARRPGEHALTGTTVVLAPPGGAVGGVDVRGAAPGTRETDLLDPHRLVERVHAVVLTGGSAYGLAAVDGVMARLEADRIGHSVGPAPEQVVPIVPAAVVFDLGRGGDFRARPGPETGAAAYDAAVSSSGAEPGTSGAGPGPSGAGPGRSGAEQGEVGAGTGAVVGGLKGGIGGASVVLPGWCTVGALVVLNAAGSAVDPATGELYGARFGLADEFAGLRTPTPAAVRTAAERVPPGLLGTLRATTLAVIGTDAPLTPAQCTLLAQMGADGLARAVRPVHTMFDGDTTFALATGIADRAPDRPAELHRLLAAAADCVTRAIVHAALAAESVTTPAGDWPSYRDAYGL
jgi:putative pantetheine hydrolase